MVARDKSLACFLSLRENDACDTALLEFEKMAAIERHHN
jgi:hypothetical protein